MNVGTLLTKSARTFPKNLAVAHGPKKLTYGQFNSRANRLANAFYKLGIKQGDNVALVQYNYPEMLESMFACFKAGCGAVPLNFRLHPNEFAFIIDHSEAKAKFYHLNSTKQSLTSGTAFRRLAILSPSLVRIELKQSN